MLNLPYSNSHVTSLLLGLNLGPRTTENLQYNNALSWYLSSVSIVEVCYGKSGYVLEVIWPSFVCLFSYTLGSGAFTAHCAVAQPQGPPQILAPPYCTSQVSEF